MIDAHVHIWQLGANDCRWPTADLRAIHRDFTIDDVRPSAMAEGVSGLLLVQSQESERDTMWLLREALHTPFVRGVIGWTDLRAGDAEAALVRLAAAGPLKGIRIMAQDRPPEYLHVAAWIGGLSALATRGLVLDLLVRPQHLPASHAVARTCPDLRIVIDHCAKPFMRPGHPAAWQTAMAPLAALPNVHCKVSGLVTELAKDQSADEVRPYMAAALNLFGPERLIWGSDWPVLQLRSDYAAWLSLARAAIPAPHHAAVFGDNARRCYGLDR